MHKLFLLRNTVNILIFFVTLFHNSNEICFVFRPWWRVPQLPPLGPEDEDVGRERERVKSGKAQSDILTMIDLSKVQTTQLKPF